MQSSGREIIKYENGMASLEISKSTLEDSGYYACIAKNSQGQSSTEATVRIYSLFETSSLSPIFTCSIKGN